MSDNETKSAYDKLTPQRKRLIDAILKNLENEKSLYMQGWRVNGAPVSAVTGKKYNGVNRMFLTAATMQKGYKDNRWLTFKQMEEKGWSFKRDEEGNSLGKNAGVPIEFFELRDRETKKPFDKSVLDGFTEDERDAYMEENVFALRKYYVVFNGDVIEGIPERERKEPDPTGRNERAEAILKFWSENEAIIIYGGDRAFYGRASDEIHLPEREQFFSLPEFYSTALHEVGHSTGHETRLNRNLGDKFGTPEYAEEELRAEIASMFIEQDLEVTVEEKHIENNGAYIKGWYEKIKDDPNVLFKAIADAEKITQFVLAKEIEAKAERLRAIEEEESEVYLLPSVIAAQAQEDVTVIGTVAAVDMAGRGVESLIRMDDREIVERASKTKQGEKFLALFNGEAIVGDEEKDERSLMARLAIHTGENTEQLLRIFRASGQFRDDKPISYYEKMAREEMQFVSSIKMSVPLASTQSMDNRRYTNTKS